MRQREARDIDRVLAGQRLLLDRLDQFGGAPAGLADANGADAVPSSDSRAASNAAAAGQASLEPLSSEVGQRYLHALQNFIFDENQSAAAAIAELTECFVTCQATSSTIMRMHLAAVTQITSHAGTGSMRHCLSGADRFLMELLMRLVDRQTVDQQTADRTQDDRSQDDRRHEAGREGAADARELGRKGRLHNVVSPLAAA
jgi:hypothetical protein